MIKRYGAFSSSINPEEIALTFRGALKLVGGVAALAVGLGFVSAADSASLLGGLDTLATQVVSIITLGYAAWGTAQSLEGIARKIFVGITTR